MRKPFMHVMRDATQVERGWSNHDIAVFHALNPNGAAAHKLHNNRVISQMVEEHDLPSGAIVAYGTFADYEYQRLMELARKQRVTRRELEVVLEGLNWQIQTQLNWIAETTAKLEKNNA
jgi:hypothetical protein